MQTIFSYCMYIINNINILDMIDSEEEVKISDTRKKIFTGTSLGNRRSSTFFDKRTPIVKTGIVFSIKD